jgi:uncharacterized protein (TIGR02147 family)
MISFTSLKKLLNVKLKERKKKNPAYSLRAFARDLEITPAQLSIYLNQEKGLSIRTVQKILNLLQVSTIDHEFILSQFLVNHFKDEKKSLPAQDVITNLKTENYTLLPNEDFDLLKEWHYCGILALIETKNFQAEESWIAARLGISPEVAAHSLQQMIALQMIQTNAAGIWEVNGSYFANPDNQKNKSSQYFHQQIIQKSLASVGTISYEKRDFSSLLMSVRADQLPEAKKLIQSFREMFDQRFSMNTPSEEKDEVFALAIQFFPVSMPAQSVNEVEQTRRA